MEGGPQLFIVTHRQVGNLAVWALNLALTATIVWDGDDSRRSWGLPHWPGLICGFLVLDFLSYALHRLFHVVPYAWRVHALHHSDPVVDLTTALRHHPGEAVPATAVYWLSALVVGVPPAAIMVHATASFCANILTHCRVRVPLERLLRWVIITPVVHQIHHSIDRIEANKNFGDVLSVWDRLFGTLLVPSLSVVARLRFGVRGVHDSDACRPLAMLSTPLRISRMYIDTRCLRDGREIELSASILGKVTRLRARLVENGVVTAAHTRDFRGPPWRTPADIAEFTREFEGIAHITAPHPLFLFAERAAA